MSAPLAPGAREIDAAAARLRGWAVRTPLLRLQAPDRDTEIWLKLECLQPVRSFKLRGAANALLSLSREALADGVWTASAGNMAQAVAWCARRLGVRCTVVVPDTAPAAKREAIARLGAELREVPFAEWFRIYGTHAYPGVAGRFVHAFADTAVMAGNATIGREILAELPEPDLVLVPFGGGGLACGIAAALRAAGCRAPVRAVEVATAAPLAAAWEAGRPVPIEHRRSFVDGIGGPCLFSEMWSLARELLAGSSVVTLAQVAAAVRLLATRACVVAEGAGAAPVAAALAATGREARRIVCVVSGGVIDAAVLASILRGEQP